MQSQFATFDNLSIDSARCHDVGKVRKAILMYPFNLRRTDAGDIDAEKTKQISMD
jgi:hypothetical protein